MTQATGQTGTDPNPGTGGAQVTITTEKGKADANPEGGIDPNAVDPSDKDADKAPKDDDTEGLKKALRATRKERDDLVKAQRDAEFAKLPELERAKAEAEELSKENAKLKTENMRRQVAMELGLPWNIAKRITGDTEDEMRNDGAELLKHFKADDKSAVNKDDPKNKKPPTNDAKAKGSAGQLGMSELLRLAAGRRAS